jgi:hypothetical protein
MVLAPIALSAQITIDHNDMPSAGDTMRYQNSMLAEFDGTDTGPAHEWHFESLPINGEAADTAVAVESTPLLYQFFFNDPFIYPDYNADYALRGQSIDFQAVTLADLYDYYKNDDDGFRNVGFGAMVNGLPSSIQRDPIDVIYRFPMDFGNTDSSASSFLISIPTLGAYGQDQMRHNEVDGWGTVYLPADTFEVLRVKSTLARTDTIYIEQFGFGLAFPEPETIEYKWLALGMDQPVLQVTTLADFPTAVRFVYDPEDISTGLASRLANGPALFPNPASDRVRIMTSGARTVEILDAQGRLVRSIAVGAQASETVLDVTTMTPGVYAVRRLGEVGAARLVVAH